MALGLHHLNLAAALLAGLAGAVQPAHAEGGIDSKRARFSDLSEASIRGISGEELTRRLGKPDSRQVNGSRAEWRYGNSLVFLIDDLVTAWSDSGDLQNREMMAMLRRPDQTGVAKSFEPEGWVSAWQRERQVTSDDVVVDLLRKK